MSNHKTLVTVILLVLFTLTAIQGIKLLQQRFNVLGETSNVGGSQPYGLLPTVAPREGTASPICAEIKKIYSTYCTQVTPTPARCTIEGEKRCNSSNIVIVCQSGLWRPLEQCPATCVAGRCINITPTSYYKPVTPTYYRTTTPIRQY